MKASAKACLRESSHNGDHQLIDKTNVHRAGFGKNVDVQTVRRTRACGSGGSAAPARELESNARPAKKPRGKSVGCRRDFKISCAK